MFVQSIQHTLCIFWAWRMRAGVNTALLELPFQIYQFFCLLSICFTHRACFVFVHTHNMQFLLCRLFHHLYLPFNVTGMCSMSLSLAHSFLWNQRAQTKNSTRIHYVCDHSKCSGEIYPLSLHVCDCLHLFN